jgi:hypothetical protein
VSKANNLPSSSADVTESGSLNLPEPAGPHRPVMECIFTLCKGCVQCYLLPHFPILEGLTVCISYCFIDIDHRLLVVKHYSYLMVSGFQEGNSVNASNLIFIFNLLIFIWC